MIDRIGPAVGFEYAARTLRRSLSQRVRYCRYQSVGQHQLSIAVVVHAAQLEGAVSHLRQHSRLVGGENGSVIVVYEGSQSDSGRTSQIDIPDGLVTQHPSNKQRRIELREAPTGFIDLEYVAEAALPEF